MSYLARLRECNKKPPWGDVPKVPEPLLAVLSRPPIREKNCNAAFTLRIPPHLEALIQRAETYWEYSPEDSRLIRELAQRDPDGLTLALESDVFVRGE
jgi:hypothetical protein